MTVIASSQNPVIKEVKSLKQRKQREDRGLFFIEGIRFVEEALKEDVEIKRIFVSEHLAEVKGGKEILERLEGLEVYRLPEKLFNEISDTENPQGILAVIGMKQYSFKQVVEKGNFFVVLDSIQDPGNMGTIIRTADAAGVSGIIASKGSVDVYNPKVLRSTMGSIFHVPICYTTDMLETIKTIKSKGIKVYASHLRAVATHFDIDGRGGAALVIGNEANGISDELASSADMLIKIPMPGGAESLNASVAAGLLMYEVVRQQA